MKPQYLINNGSVRIIKLPDEALQPTIPPAVYTLVHDDMGGFSLIHMHDKYDTPKRLYGTIKKRSSRIVDTFLDRQCSTGVAITGLKGAGKSELAKQTCNKVIAAGYPIVIINESYSGTEFNNFIQDLGVCAIFYDEFAKIFNKSAEDNKGQESKSSQEQLLTLFDGSVAGKRLIIITENYYRAISSYFLERPGRIYYHYDYDKLEDAVVKGYTKDLKLSKKFAKEVIGYSRRSTTFTFDSLKAICEQKLRYNESLVEITKELNVITVIEKEQVLVIEEWHCSDPDLRLHKKTIEDFNPKDEVRLDYMNKGRDGGEYEDYAYLNPHDIVYSDGKRVGYKHGPWTILGKIEEKDIKVDISSF